MKGKKYKVTVEPGFYQTRPHDDVVIQRYITDRKAEGMPESEINKQLIIVRATLEEIARMEGKGI